MNKRNYQLFLCENRLESSTNKYLLGDVNGDGELSSIDARLILQCAGGTPLTELYDRTDITLDQFKRICDVNSDGRIDEKDAKRLFQIIEGSLSSTEITFSHLVSFPVLELGSSTSESTGQAFNIEFYSKIDGTHELTFELPQFYFDENIGENIENPLVKYISNKCQLELHIDGETYFMVVNSRTDSEKGIGAISYKYECTDAFIEELSKSGYGITFSDDVEGNGFGTIHDFSEQVAQGTEWVYDRDKTGVLLEYERGLEWDIVNAQYKETRTPKPVHKVKYIPELGRYCNELKYLKKINNDNLNNNALYVCCGDVDRDGKFSNKDIEEIRAMAKDDNHSIEELEKADVNGDGKISNYDARVLSQIVAKEGIDTEKLQDWSLPITKELVLRHNLKVIKKLNNASSSPLSPTYHRIYSYEDSEQITSNTVQNYLYNGDDFVDLVGWNTYTLDGKDISYGPVLTSIETDSAYDLKVNSSETWYLINETTQETNKPIYSGDPYVFRWTGNEGVINGIYIYSADPRSNPDKLVYSSKKVLSRDEYHVIKTSNFINNPYIVFEVNGNLQAHSFEFFAVKGKKTEYQDADTNYLTLLSVLTDGSTVSSSYLKLMQLPTDALSAYTHKTIKYFIRDNYETDRLGIETQVIKDSEKDSVTYIDINELFNDFLLPSSQRLFYELSNNSFIPAVKVPVKDVDNLPITGDVGIVYRKNEDRKFYQYYTVTDKNNNTGGGWDYAFYDEKSSDKRRTLNLSKSNRFNIIQELSELFRVWPVFEMVRDVNGKVVKKFWYRENCIQENFSGFHKDVNIETLSRTIDSNNIVTKMYVEDQENEYVENGFVTIRTSPLNPWGENYYYNFQYYVNQKLLDRESIEKDLENLYSNVKDINYNIREINDKLAAAKPDLSNLTARLKSLAVSIAACNERITSLNADITNYEGINGTAIPDCQNSEMNVQRQLQQKEKFENEIAITQTKYDKLKEEIQGWQQEVIVLQSEKTILIHDFENKYSQFIKEGVWTDNSYIDNTQYYLDSLDVMNTSSMPHVEWSISVIDGSLIDGLEEFQFTVGDQTILVDNEFFMKAPNENYQFSILVTGTKEFLDKPVSNIIEVRNFFTSFEDIFQRISAATQTLELKEQTYNKAEYFTPDGQIDQSILQNSLLNNALILANSTDNSYILDNTGLHLQSILNPTKKLRAIADGIFISNSNDPLTGEPKWMTGITADGINASVLTAGQINTSVVRIYTDGMPAFSWNNLGITAYKFINDGTQVDSNSFIRLDSFGLYSVDSFDNSIFFNYDSNGKPWFDRLSREEATQQILDKSIVSITDKGFNLNIGSTKGSIRLGYVDKLEIDSSSGDEVVNTYYGLQIRDYAGTITTQLQNDGDNYIAGWKISSRGLYYGGNEKQSYDYNHSPVGMSANNFNWAFWAGYNYDTGKANFRVTQDGFLYAKGAEITGDFLSGIPDEGCIEVTTFSLKNKTYPVLLFSVNPFANDPDCEESDIYYRYQTGISCEFDVDDLYYRYFSLVSRTLVAPGAPDEFMPIGMSPLWSVDWLSGEIIFAPQEFLTLKNTYNLGDEEISILTLLAGDIFYERNAILSYTSPYMSDYYIGATRHGLWSGDVTINGVTLYFENGVLYNVINN